MMTHNMREILARLRALRLEKGLRQADMADRIGVDRSTYVRKERGSIPISTEEWLTISVVLDKEISLFFAGHKASASLSGRNGNDEALFNRLLRALRPEEKKYLYSAVTLMFKGVRRKEVSLVLSAIRRLK